MLFNFKHGQSNAGGKRRETPTYKSWQEMWRRCTVATHPSYPNYGGKGIAVCSAWKDFLIFLKDMGQRPKGMSLDRIDNNKGYCAENCRWADRKTQNNNRSQCHVIEFDGATRTLAQWCEYLNIPYARTYHRYVIKKEPPEKAFRPGNTPRNEVCGWGKKYSFQGKQMTIRAISELSGVDCDLIRQRMTRDGLTLEEAAT